LVHTVSYVYKRAIQTVGNACLSKTSSRSLMWEVLNTGVVKLCSLASGRCHTCRDLLPQNGWALRSPVTAHGLSDAFGWAGGVRAAALGWLWLEALHCRVMVKDVSEGDGLTWEVCAAPVPVTLSRRSVGCTLTMMT